MAEQRKGDWAQTYTGKKFWALDPRPEDVCIEDIAHALALQCRYNGHCLEFYSIAQHSVLVSQVVEAKAIVNHKEVALIGLLHDAAEAYVGDMIRPLKRSLPAFQSAETLVALAIGERFGVRLDLLPSMVEEADNRLLSTEARDIVLGGGRTWNLPLPPFVGMRIEPVGPKEAEALFLARWNELTSK